MLCVYLCVYVIFHACIPTCSYTLQLDVLRADNERPQLRRPQDCSEVKDRMQAAFCRSEHRLQRFFGGSKLGPSESIYKGFFQYYVNITVSGLQEKVALVPDTASSLLWASRADLELAHFDYISPNGAFCEALLRRLKGSEVVGEACKYLVKYGDGSYYSRGYMVLVNMTLLGYDKGDGPERIENVPLGRDIENNVAKEMKGAHGVLGLGRSTGITFAENAFGYPVPFSYCLPMVGQSGFLRFHTTSDPKQRAHDRFANIIADGSLLPFWYINVRDIYVNKSPLGLEGLLAFDADSKTKGTVVDSGSRISKLVPELYSAFETAYVSALPSGWRDTHPAHPIGKYKTCFRYDTSFPLGDPPNVEFSLGADIFFSPPPITNLVLLHTHAGKEYICLAYTSTKSRRRAFLLGARTQLTTRFLFDESASRISWAYRACT